MYIVFLKITTFLWAFLIFHPRYTSLILETVKIKFRGPRPRKTNTPLGVIWTVQWDDLILGAKFLGGGNYQIIFICCLVVAFQVEWIFTFSTRYLKSFRQTFYILFFLSNQTWSAFHFWQACVAPLTRCSLEYWLNNRFSCDLRTDTKYAFSRFVLW